MVFGGCKNGKTTSRFREDWGFKAYVGKRRNLGILDIFDIF